MVHASSLNRTEATDARVAEPQRIRDGLWRIGGGSWDGAVPALSAEGDANVYLIQAGTASIIVDCGSRIGHDRIVANLDAIGQDPGTLTDVILTHSHWDHSEAAALWQAEVPSIRTHLSRVGAEFILDRGDHRLIGYQTLGPGYTYEPFKVDHRVTDGDVFELGNIRLLAHDLPGHTPDSGLYTFTAAGVTVGIGGDVMFGRKADGSIVLGRLSALWMSNLDDYVRSLQRLAGTEIDLLLPGHGQSVCGRGQVDAIKRETLTLAKTLASNPQVRQNTFV